LKINVTFSSLEFHAARASLGTILLTHWGASVFLAIAIFEGRGGGHALLPVEEFLGHTNLQRPAGIPQTIDMSTRIRAVLKPFAPENVISPAFSTI
jgi:hypothetical protein